MACFRHSADTHTDVSYAPASQFTSACHGHHELSRSRLTLITALPLVHSSASSVRLGGERQPTPPTPEHVLPPNRDPGLMSFVDTQDAGLSFCHTDTTTSPHWLLTSDHCPSIPTDQIFENVVLGPELMPTRPVPADAPSSSRLATEASPSRDTPDALASCSAWTDLEPRV